MLIEGKFDQIDPFVSYIQQWEQHYLKLDTRPFSAEMKQYVGSDFHFARVILNGHLLQLGSPSNQSFSIAIYDGDLPGTSVRGRQLIDGQLGTTISGATAFFHVKTFADIIVITLPLPVVNAHFSREITGHELCMSPRHRKQIFKQ